MKLFYVALTVMAVAAIAALMFMVYFVTHCTDLGCHS
jgi:hypothetical protein